MKRRKKIKVTESQFKTIWKSRIGTGAVFVMEHSIYAELAEFIKAIEGAKIR